MKYFVLKPVSTKVNDEHANASIEAIYAYADYIRPHNPELAKDLEDWMFEIRKVVS